MHSKSNVGGLELVLTVGAQPGMKRDRSPEELGEAIGAIRSTTGRITAAGFVGYVAHAAYNKDLFRSRTRFSELIDLVDCLVEQVRHRHCLSRPGRGPRKPRRGALRRNAQRRGDTTGTRRINSSQATTHSQGAGIGTMLVAPNLSQVESPLGIGRMLGRELRRQQGPLRHPGILSSEASLTIR